MRAILRRIPAASLSPVVTVLSALSMAALVAIAGRDGQFTTIAAYTAGTGAGSIVAVMLSGGTTLRYVTGSATDRSTVLAYRRRLVTPLLGGAALITSIGYAWTAHLPVTAVAAGGLASMLANHFELSGGDLQRQGRIPTWGSAIVGPRLLGVAALALGASFAVVMFTAQALTAFFGWLLTRHEQATQVHVSTRAWSLWRAAHSRDHTWLALSTAGIMRLPFLVAPFIAGAHAAGQLAVLVSAQQAMTSALIAGLYTTMAMRSKGAVGMSIRQLRAQEALVIGIAITIAATGPLLAGPLLSVFGMPPTSASTTWWTLLALGIPAMLGTRAIQFRLMAESQARLAARLINTVLVVSLIVGILAILLSSLVVVAGVTLGGELTGLVAALVWTRLINRRTASARPS